MKRIKEIKWLHLFVDDKYIINNIITRIVTAYIQKLHIRKLNLSVEIIKNFTNEMKLFLFEDEFLEHR
jgi:hypothetical protein